MKQRTRILCAVVTIFVALSVPCLTMAHSGRTDSAGGHRDNNNVSGLGPYHYHHGYGPHLHPNGVCPYSKPAASTSYQSQSVIKAAPVPSGTMKSVAKPKFPVIVNGTNLNVTSSQYYPIVIDNVTYVPMSTEVINSLNLSGGWDATNGLVLKSK